MQGAALGADTFYGAGGAHFNITSTVSGNAFVLNDSTHGGVGTNQTADFNGSLASGGNQFWAGSGNATLIGGTGTDTLVAGAGASTITGGSGAFNYFDFFATNSGANVTITDFGSASGNLLTFFNYGASTVNAIIRGQDSHQINTGVPATSGTLISLNDGTKILLQGYQGSLNSSNVLGT